MGNVTNWIVRMWFILIGVRRPESGTGRQNVPELSPYLSLSGMRRRRGESNHKHDTKTERSADADRIRYIALSCSSTRGNTETSKWNTCRSRVRAFMGAACSFTLAALFSWYMDGSSAGFPAAHLVALMSSARALATSRTAFIRTTWGDRAGVNANTMVRVRVYLWNPRVRI